jgi:hypothetical protein
MSMNVRSWFRGGLAAWAVGLGLAAEPMAAPSAMAQRMTLTRQVRLELLVISAADVGTVAIMAGLREAGVPFRELDLADPARPRIDDAFLTESPAWFVRRARYQALVTPSDQPAGLLPEEAQALARYQREFGIRRLDSYVYPSPSVHMTWPHDGGFVGAFDGATARVTPAGRAAAFDYLVGPIPFDDASAQTLESWGYLATALPPDAAQERSFTPLLELTLPSSDAPPRTGVLAGVLSDAGREVLVLTAALNPHQFQLQALFPGLLRWLTRGVYLGTERNYFSMHVDDLFLANTRWVPDHDCTMDGDCPMGLDVPDILMTPADVDQLLAWQAEHAFQLQLAFNGGGYALALEDAPTFPLGDTLIARQAELRWINHTYTHEFMGCAQDFTQRPLRCLTDATGALAWVPFASIDEQIRKNLEFAAQHGMAVAPDALVTGEHGGLRRAPEEPSDNPELLRALDASAIAWLASDYSREREQRAVAAAYTLPRYPLNLYFNVATRRELVDEYNWIYTKAADGGSGRCENNPLSTCITPLDVATGYDEYVVPQEAKVVLQHILSNSPRPHYAHQSNLAEDRLLYPLLERILTDYRRVFADEAPLVDLTMGEAGLELKRAADWQRNRSRVTGYLEGSKLVLAVSGSGSVHVPLTLPAGSAVGGKPVLDAYAGSQTGWRQVVSLLDQALTLPSSLGYAE